MIAHRETTMPDMSQLLSGFTPSRETPYAEISVPPGRPVSFLARVTPGPPVDGREVTLFLAQRPDWLRLWEIASDDAALRLYERDAGIRGMARPGDGPFEIRITYEPATGELRLLQGDFAWELACARRTTSGFSLFVGAPPGYKNIGRAEGWRFDLSWSLGEEPAPPIVAPEEHPALAKIRRAVLEIKNAEAAIEKAVADLKGERR